MPRKAAPWYRRARDEWYVTIRGRKTPLGVKGEANGDLAHAAWRQIVQGLQQLHEAGGVTPPAPMGTNPDPRALRSVRELVAEFLATRPPRVGSATRASYRWGLGAWLDGLGHRASAPLASLLASEAEAAAERDTWSSSTRNSVLGSVMVFLKWAGHPLHVHRPPKESRGAESVVSDEQFHQVLGAARGDFREYLRVLRETGARPGEVAGLTVEGVDWSNRVARLREHKTRRHGQVRTIYFTPAAMDVLDRQRARHGTGHLFRNNRDRPFSAVAVCQRMQTIAERVGFRVFAYGLGRHSFCTKALANGVPEAIVAELLGHRGTSMLHRHYSHVGAMSDVLRSAAEKAAGTPLTPPPAAG